MAAAGESRRRLLDVLTPVVAGLGFDLEDVQVSSVGRRSLVRVVVDADHGVDLDAVADISRAVSEVLDAEGGEGFSGPYVLEVSSPGVDRPLVEPRHWRRATGRLVQVPVGGESVTGRVARADSDGVHLTVDGGVTRSVAWASLGPGRVQVEFNRPDSDDMADDSEEGGD